MRRFIHVLILVLLTTFDGGVVSATAPYWHVAGNKIVAANGQTYIPEGISIYGGLEMADYDLNTANVYAQIQAAAAYWHANTVRLQVAESNLFSDGHEHTGYNHTFLATLSQEVAYAHHLGLLVVVNDQTEFTSKTPAPTSVSLRFWHLIATKFGSNPYVIFDVFNEPRLTSINSTILQPSQSVLSRLVGNRLLRERTAGHHSAGFSADKVWKLWQNGGRVNGVVYVGMQQLVQTIRKTGATNLIWLEGSYGARVLPPIGHLIHGPNLVYAIHHPNLNSPASWRRISNLAARQPVVEGEWAQYESNWAECYSHAYKNVPLYLHFLQQHKIGVIAWSLQAGSLIRGDNRIRPTNLNTLASPVKPQALSNPSRLLPNYTCTGLHHGEGAGRLLMRYFKQNSIHYSL